jgi:hypothetical protein
MKLNLCTTFSQVPGLTPISNLTSGKCVRGIKCRGLIQRHVTERPAVNEYHLKVDNL